MVYSNLRYKYVLLFFYIGIVFNFHYGLSAVEEMKSDACIQESIRLMSAASNSVVGTHVNYDDELHHDIIDWSPLQMTNGEGFTFGKFALVILNCPIKIDPEEMVTFWNKAEIRVTVDGGTDRWYDFCNNLTSDLTLTKRDPDLVTGDFDSIEERLLWSCRNDTNIKVVCTPSQVKTDFMKALEEVDKCKDDKKLDSILVIAEHCGRLDQILSNLDTLHRSNRLLGLKDCVFIMTRNSLTWLLKPGHHVIHIPARIWSSNYWCGLLPLIGRTLVTTSGLKWDLNNQNMEFGELISTSNTYGEPSNQRNGVTVKTNRNLIWTMSINMK